MRTGVSVSASRRDRGAAGGERNQRIPFEEKKKKIKEARGGWTRTEEKRSPPPSPPCPVARKLVAILPLILPHLAHHDVESIACHKLQRGELARRRRSDCKRVC